jgi:hypothetical protein
MAESEICVQTLSEAIGLLQSDDNASVVQLLKDLIPTARPTRNAAFVYGLALWKLGQYGPAHQAILRELEFFPDSLEAKELLPELQAKTVIDVAQVRPGSLDSSADHLHGLFSEGKADEILAFLDPRKLQGPPPRRFFTLRAFAYMLKSELSYAHEALWEELRYYPESLEPREHLRKLNFEPVIHHLISSLPSRLDYDIGRTVLGVSMMRNGTFPGGAYCQMRDVSPDLGRNMRYIAALAELQFGRASEAARHLIGEVSEYHDNQNAIDLFKQLLREIPENEAHDLEGQFQRARRERAERKPYVVFSSGIDTSYAGRVYDVPKLLLGPVFELARNQFDSTMITCEGREGLQGTSFVLGCLRVERKPDVVVVMRPWWGDESIVALTAREMGIPVVFVCYGATFFECPSAVLRSTILPASVCCIWSLSDYKLSREVYNCKEPLIITGNPMFDRIIETEQMTARTIPDLPDEFALILTSTNGYEADRIYAAAESISRFMPVVIKAHPLESDLERWSSRWPTFHQSSHLLELLYRSSVVLSPLSSAVIPAIYWEKKIFILREDQPYYPYEKLKSDFSHIFNFMAEPELSLDQLQTGIRARREDFAYFGHSPDGKAAQRVFDVIRNCVV